MARYTFRPRIYSHKANIVLKIVYAVKNNNVFFSFSSIYKNTVLHSIKKLYKFYTVEKDLKVMAQGRRVTLFIGGGTLSENPYKLSAEEGEG